MIIPSIDLMSGKAVQLMQGKEKVLERTDVFALARKFSRVGDLAVIDLDAAFGKGNNIDLIKKLCAQFPCRVGGGIRTIERAREYIRAGAKKIIIGTMATTEFVQQLPKEKVIIALDEKNGYVVNEGWTKTTKKTPRDVVRELESYCSGFLYTIVDKEGLLQGTDVEKIQALRAVTKKEITAAGGITSIGEIKELDAIDVNAQLGMALYTGKIKLEEAFVALSDFDKNNGLIPTIVQDEQKDVLMLAFSNKASLQRTIRTGKACYYSRSRKKLWTKGETSGNDQTVLRIRTDCDRDTLRFTVTQKNSACHKGLYSCFGEEAFDLSALYTVIVTRKNNPLQGSYTAQLLQDETLLKKKIVEEAYEVATASTKPELVWELADVLYFSLVLMAKKGITLKNIYTELESRRGQRR